MTWAQFANDHFWALCIVITANVTIVSGSIPTRGKA